MGWFAWKILGIPSSCDVIMNKDYSCSEEWHYFSLTNIVTHCHLAGYGGLLMAIIPSIPYQSWADCDLTKLIGQWNSQNSLV